MKKLWTDRGWNDYEYWQTQDKKTLKRLNQIIRDIERNGYDGIGKPEQLKGDLSGWWSRRIDDANRIVYRLRDNDIVEISQCRGITTINRLFASPSLLPTNYQHNAGFLDCNTDYIPLLRA